MIRQPAAYPGNHPIILRTADFHKYDSNSCVMKPSPLKAPEGWRTPRRSRADWNRTATARSWTAVALHRFLPPIPATPQSSCERKTFIFSRFCSSRGNEAPFFWNSQPSTLNQPRTIEPPHQSSHQVLRPGRRRLLRVGTICLYRRPCPSPFSARGPVPAISRTSRRSGSPAPAATG